MNTTKIFACRTLEEEVMAVLPGDVDYEFLEYEVSVVRRDVIVAATMGVRFLWKQ